MQCPRCRGQKEIPIAFPHDKDNATLPCLQCNRTGEVSDEMIQWMEDGEILRKKRIEVRCVLRNAARKVAEEKDIKMDSAIIMISDMERGVIKPDMSIYDNL